MKKNSSRNESGRKSRSTLLRGDRLFPGERVQQRLILFLSALLLTVIIIPKSGFVADSYSPGDISSRDIKAPKDLLIPDLPLTEKKRLEAEEAVLPLYDYDAGSAREIGDRLVEALASMQAEAARENDPVDLPGDKENVPPAAPGDQALEKSQASYADERIYQDLRKAVTASLHDKIVGNLQLFEADRQSGILIRNLASQKEEQQNDLTSVIGPGEVQERFRKEIAKIEGLSESNQEQMAALFQKMLRPNLTFNKNETEARKRKAKEEVKPVLFQVKKGEMIVREGERISEEQIRKIRAMRETGSDYSALKMGVGLFLSIILLVFAGHRYANVNVSKYRLKNSDMVFLVVSFVGLIILIKVAIFISTALESAFPYIDSSTYFYAFPFAVGAMLVRIVLNSETALIFILVSSFLFGLLFGDNLFISLYALVGSLVGAQWVRHCKERTTLYQAGLWISLANMALILGIHLIAGRAFDLQLFYKMAFGFAGGIICAIIVTGTIPLAEFFFGYTTDIKLLELANLNSPLLRELMIRAPGTYHHSIIVGNLAEAGAEAINANPLLARVAAYYHDIGKIRKPLYFIENLGGQDNRHDKLAPSMSALILMSHVKDGTEMARENRLGEPLIEIIHQHHGTSLIKFFYDKAKNKEDTGVQQVDERDYRYPGPRPQTREAALIMLADAVEAASRTLTDPTPARIKGMVQKITNNFFTDGQLDECELTLKDLHKIARSFHSILTGIFHHRVDYPEPAFKEREKEPSKKKKIENLYREPPKEIQGKETRPAKGGAEDLKRLGMS